jgi:hypothetical protein
MESISRAWLQRRLGVAALIRSWITLPSALGVVYLLSLFPGIDRDRFVCLIVFLFFSIPMLIGWLVTVCICRRMVKCPYCRHSLWECGTGNFKPRRMKVRDDVQQCPNCGVPFARVRHCPLPR